MPKVRTTKAEALEMFQEVKEHIQEKYGKDDKIALREAWNDYIDGLLTDGVISRRQYDIWVNPF